MGLHVGGIYIQADNKKITQRKVANFIREYWLNLGAKESKENPLEFDPLSLEKTGKLAFAICPSAKDVDGKVFIGIYDSERYSADPGLAWNLADHFGKNVWFYEITDSVNQAYVKCYGKKEKVITKYDRAIEKAETFPFTFLYFNQLKEVSKKELKDFIFLAFEDIPHRPNAKYSGPSDDQLKTNDLVVQAKKLAKEKNAKELRKLADNHSVYYNVIKNAVDSADPSKSEDQIFLTEMTSLMIGKDDVDVSILESALRRKDEKAFAKVLKIMKRYNLFALEMRAFKLKDDKEDYLAFRLMEAYVVRTDYQDPRLVNNALYFLDKVIRQPGIPKKRIERLLKASQEAGKVNPAIYHNLACVFVKFKEHEKALEAVSAAVQYGYDQLDKLKKDPDLKPIKSDARFLKAFRQKTELQSFDHLKMLRKNRPWIVPSIGLHLYFSDDEARVGAAELLQELRDAFPEMFVYYLKSGHIDLFPTPKGKVSRDITMLKKGGAPYGYNIYYNALGKGDASDLRFMLELYGDMEGEITIQLPLNLADDPEALYERLVGYASKLPFVSGNAGYSFVPYYEHNGCPAQGDMFRLMQAHWGFTTSVQSQHAMAQTQFITPNWLTFIGLEMAKRVDLKGLPNDRIQTLDNKGLVIRAAEKPFVGLSSNPSDLDLLPQVTKALKNFLPKKGGRWNAETYFGNEAMKFEKILTL